jgi:hypothetical protein
VTIHSKESRNRPGESDDARWDRNYGDLLQEIRVAQTGVQILFAFLITLPFSARFEETKSHDHIVYVVTLLAAAVASALLIAPVSYHRMNFRKGRKEELVRTASRLATYGVACLMVAIVGAVFIVMDVTLGPLAGVALAALILATCGFLWFLLPLRHRFDDR